MTAALALPTSGIHRGISSMTYHREWTHAVSKSSLFKIIDCPARFREAFDNPRDPTPDMILGSLAHTLTFEPDQFDAEYAVAPEVNKRTKDGRAEYEAFRAANIDKTVVTGEQIETAGAIAASVRAHPLAAQLIADCEFESSILWTDCATGILCKCRPDGLRRGYNDPARGLIVDLKTCRSIEKFHWDARELGYLFQASLYTQGVHAVTGEWLTFQFVAVEKEPPYLVQVFDIDVDTLRLADAQVQQALELLAYCREVDKWPGYKPVAKTIQFDHLQGAHYA